MKAIVHIGIEKTGTTSIQEYLYQNQKQLKDNGFYFIQSAGKRNNWALPFYCMSDDKYDYCFNHEPILKNKGITSLKRINKFKHVFINNFQNEIKSIQNGIHTVIISSEHFHSRTNTQEEVDNVYELLSSVFSEIKIVCYLREQVATRTSSYSRAIWSGGSLSIDDFIQQCKPENIYFNYYEMLMNWERSFGLESLDVSLFDPNQFLNGDLLDDFTAKINPNLVGTLNKNISTENESLNYAGQVLGKAINKVFPRYIERDGLNSVRAKCEEIVYRECKGKGEQPSLDIQDKIFSEFSESNERLRQKFFPEMNTIFKPRSDETLSNKIIDDGLVDILSSIFNVVIEDGKGIILPDRYANLFRDTALKIEKDDLKSAFELMSLAHKIRPSDRFIKQKLEEYRQNIGK